MLPFKLVRQYTQTVDSIKFQLDPRNPFLMVYLGENTSLLEDYEKLNLRKVDFKRVVIPVTKIPYTRPTNDIIRQYKSLGMFVFNTNQKIPEKQNLIYDLSNYVNTIDTMYKVNTYRQRAGFLLNNMILKAFAAFPDNYQKVLLYSIDPTKPMNNFIDRKIFPILLNIKKQQPAFEHLLMNTISGSSSRYRLLIKDNDFKFDRVKTYLKRAEPIDVEKEEEQELHSTTLQIMDKVDNDITPENKDKVKFAITKFLSKNKEVVDDIQQTGAVPNEKAKEIASASILSLSTGNMNRAISTAKSIPSAQKSIALKAINSQYADELLKPSKATISSDNVVIQMSNVPKQVDNKNPEHLFEKRKIDFEKNLIKDMSNSFKVLQTKELPIKVQNIKVIKNPPSIGELKPSDVSTIVVQLTDQFNNKHEVNIDIPNIKEDGTFYVNGKKKCLINQMVLLPISFPKPYDSKFESSYSTFHIWSKRTKRESYLEAYIGSYKLPFMVLLAYSFGFNETLKLYGVTAKFHDEKPENPSSFMTLLEDGRYLTFENVETDLQKELCQSLLHADLSKYKIKKDFPTRDYFNDLIIRMTGRVNSTFLIQSNLENIVDPVVKQVLINKQLPHELDLIMKYMASKCVTGFQQERNDISLQRIRNSEIVVHLAQKQILAAYTEYKEQVLSGNKKAKFNISQTKTLSDFVNSEIVADMEYANPIEEMATKTRLSPVGKEIGGIPDKTAIQNEGRNVHDSMYGNIDPLDTPEGPNVGIVQQLTVDAYITSTRGLIHEKEKKEGEDSGLLSTSTCLIPFVENNDGARVMFGANQARQGLPLKNPEPPMIQSGYESILTNVLSESFIKKSPCSGKVTAITNDVIQITCSNGRKQYVDVTPTHLRSGSGKDTLSVFNPKVKLGQMVKDNQIIAEGSCIANGSIAMGKSLCVAIMPYKGFNFEDGIVVSESVVKEEKLTSLHGIVEEVEVSKDDRVVDIAKIGQYTKKGDHLLRKSIGEIEQLVGFDDEQEGEDIIAGHFIKKSPGGKIVDIEVFCNVRDTHFSNLKELIDRTRKRYNVKPNEKFKIRGERFDGLLVRFKIEQELPIGVGDKLTNRHGAKGVIGLIEEEKNMPISPTGDRIEVITNPAGIIGRMNMGQFYELYVGLIAKEMGRRIISFGKNKGKVIALMNSVLPKLDTTKNKEFSKNLINNFKAMSAAKFNLFLQQIHNSGNMTLLIAPFKAPAYKEIMAAMKVLGLKPGYKLKLPEFHTSTKYDVPIGYQYVMKLEHIASEKIHSRSTGPVVSKTLQPTSGKRREGGQRMGEADTYSFISYNCPNLLAEFMGPLSDDAGTKNEIIADIIERGDARYRPAKTSPVKDLLNSYFISLMLWR